MQFQPSPQQSAILDAALGTSDNIIVHASAGSGKTTTLVWLQSQLPQPDGFIPSAVLFLAFNKDICEALKPRVPRTTSVSTFHALGLRALRDSGVVRWHQKLVDGQKCGKILFRSMSKTDPDFQSVLRLVSVLKSQVSDQSEALARQLASRFDIGFENPQKSVALALRVLETSNSNLDTIDYDDMLYLAVRHSCRFQPQDWIFVDEAQDTNDIQIEIVARMQKPGGYSNTAGAPFPPSPTRLVFVGDPNQAIYGFRGANSDSMDRIASRFACKRYPLSVSYRCPKAVVAEARRVLAEPL